MDAYSSVGLAMVLRHRDMFLGQLERFLLRKVKLLLAFFVGASTCSFHESISDSKAANAIVSGPILLKIELIQTILYVLITCKFKTNRINRDQEKVYISILRHSRAANSLVSRQIWPKFKLIKAIMHVLVTCKYQNDPIKNQQDTVETPFSPL